MAKWIFYNPLLFQIPPSLLDGSWNAADAVEYGPSGGWQQFLNKTLRCLTVGGCHDEILLFLCTFVTGFKETEQPFGISLIHGDHC